MNALTWKRIKQIKQKPINTALFFIIPLLYLIILYFSNISINNILAFLPLTFTIFSTIIHFSTEYLVTSETLLATNLSVKNIWLNNLFFIVISGYIYSTVVTICGLIFINYAFGFPIELNYYVIIELMLNFFVAFGLVGCATCHYSDYTFIKQIIASLFAIINLIAPFIFIFLGKYIFINNLVIVSTVILAFVFISISYFIISKSNKEKLISNVQKLILVYNNSSNIEE